MFKILILLLLVSCASERKWYKFSCNKDKYSPTWYSQEMFDERGFRCRTPNSYFYEETNPEMIKELLRSERERGLK